MPPSSNLSDRLRTAAPPATGLAVEPRERTGAQAEESTGPPPPAGAGYPIWAVALAVSLYCVLFWSGVSWLLLSLV